MASIDTSIYKRPEELLQNLIRFDTTNPPGNELPLMQYIDSLLTAAGFDTAFIAKEPNRPNLFTRLKGRVEAPPLLLYGHADVVTAANQKWTYPPFEGMVADGYVWGSGALDMKCGLAMMIAALLNQSGKFSACRRYRFLCHVRRGNREPAVQNSWSGNTWIYLKI